MRRGVALALFALVGCNTNAVLELTIDLPPTTDTVYAFVQVRTMTDFSARWTGADPLDGFLLGAAPTPQPISIVGQPGDFDEDVLVRVTFCSAPRCDGFGDDRAPERRLRIEHPFYELKRTRARWTIDAVPMATPADPDVIERCSVEGCRDGTTRDFCRRSDGTHFCE